MHYSELTDAEISTVLEDYNVGKFVSQRVSLMKELAFTGAEIERRVCK